MRAATIAAPTMPPARAPTDTVLAGVLGLCVAELLLCMAADWTVVEVLDDVYIVNTVGVPLS